MPTPAANWDLVRVCGTWHGLDGALLAGTYTVTFPARVTDKGADVIIPAGVFASKVPLTVTGSGPSLDFMCPATDDPDIEQTGWKVQIDVAFTGGQSKESYTIDVPYANRPAASGGNDLGVNLRTCAMPSAIPQQNALYKVGVPGGLAQLDANGQVVDADGTPVTGGSGTGAVDSVNGKTGAVVLSSSDVGALPSSYVPAWSTVSGKPTFATVATTGAYGDLTGKPTLGTAAAAATTDFDPAGAAAAVTVSSIGAATAAQGTKADTAVQPAGLTQAAVGLGNVDNTSDLAKPISTATQTALNAKADTADLPTDVGTIGGTLLISQLPANSVVRVKFTSANYQSLARPTTRTDICVWWIGDATTSSTTIPVNSLADDVVDVKTG